MRIVLCFFLLLSLVSWAQTEPQILSNGMIHTAKEPAFRGFVVMSGGKIIKVGRGQAPAGSSLDLRGQHLYPGLIDADTALGLVDVESLRASRDLSEVGEINPNLQSRYAFRAESPLIPVARSQGVLFAGVNPTGSLIAGQGSVMRLWGWTWEDMTVKPNWAMAVDWPWMPVRLETDKKKLEKSVKSLGTKISMLQEAFAQAKVYQRGEREDVKWEALAPYAKSQKPIVLRATNALAIEKALDWSRDNGLRIILSGGRDLHRFRERLAKQKVSVIYSSLNALNPVEEQPYDTHYRTPFLLRKAGVLVSLSPSGMAFDVRELRDLAGRASAFGLKEHEALQMVTLNPAKSLGLDRLLGSIEVGKEASLVLCDGSILEVTPRVTKAWGQGVELDLSDHHKRLYEKYRAKPRVRSSAVH